MNRTINMKILWSITKINNLLEVHDTAWKWVLTLNMAAPLFLNAALESNSGQTCSITTKFSKKIGWARNATYTIEWHPFWRSILILYLLLFDKMFLELRQGYSLGIKGHSQTALTRGGGQVSGSSKISTLIRQKLAKKIVNVVCEQKYIRIIYWKKWWKYTIQTGLNVECLLRIYFRPLCTSTATFSFSLLYFI